MQPASTASKASKLNAINQNEGQAPKQQQQQAMNQQQLSSGINNGTVQLQNQSVTSAGQAASATIGQGTINQQKLKSHVQQLVNKIRKESDQFYKKFVEICKNYRDTEKCMEFHSEVGKLFHPYGDLIGEINNVLHIDYQYKIPESSQNTTLKDSAISNSNVQRNQINADGSQNKNLGSSISSNLRNEGETGKKKENNTDNNNNKEQAQSSNAQNAEGLKKQEKKLTNQQITQKLSEFCQVINVECPDKMPTFVTALKQKLNGQDDQLKLFIQTCKEIFSEDHSIYKKAITLFPDNNLLESDTVSNENQPQQQAQNQNNTTGQSAVPTTKKCKKKTSSNTPASINQSTLNQNSQNNVNGNNVEKTNNQNNNNQSGISSADLNQPNQGMANGINKTSVNNYTSVYPGTPNGNTLPANNYRVPLSSARGDDYNHPSVMKRTPNFLNIFIFLTVIPKPNMESNLQAIYISEIIDQQQSLLEQFLEFFLIFQGFLIKVKCQKL